MSNVSYSHLLLKKIIETRDADYLERIDRSWLAEKEKFLFDEIREMLGKMQILPTFEMLRVRGHVITSEDTNLSIDQIIDVLVKQHILGRINEFINNMSSYMTFDKTEELIKALGLEAEKCQEVLNDSRKNSEYTSLYEHLDVILQEASRLKESGDASAKIGSGYPAIDLHFGGFAKKALYLFAARMKEGKTYFLVYMAIHAFLEGHRVAFINTEMSNIEISERATAIMTGILDKIIRDRKLSSEYIARIHRLREKIFDIRKNFIYLDDEQVLDTQAVGRRLAKFRPDIIFVDSPLMDGATTDKWKGRKTTVDDIAKGYKQVAKALDAPVVLSIHLSREFKDELDSVTGEYKKALTHHVAESDFLARICHGLFTIRNSPSSEEYKFIDMIAARVAPEFTFKVHFDFKEMNFSQIDEKEVDRIDTIDTEDPDLIDMALDASYYESLLEG